MLINILLLLSIIGSLVVGLIVYLNNKNQTSNKAFFLLAIATAIWTAFNLLTNLSNDNSMATWFARLTIIPVLLIGYSIWILSYNFPFRRKFPKLLNVIFIITIAVLAPLSLTSLNIVVSSPSGSTFETGIVYSVSTLFFIFVLLFALVNYLKMLFRAHGQDRQRVMFVVVGFFASALLGFLVAVILPILGITALLQAVPTVTIIMLASFAYAIVRHKLFDLRALVARSFSFIISIGFLATLYGLLAFQVVSRLLPVDVDKTTLQLIYTALAIILAFTFQPIRRFFERVSNKIFYKDRYDAQQLVNEIGRIVAGEIDLDKMTKAVLKELTGKMKIVHAEIVIFGEKQLFYENNVFNINDTKISEAELRKLGRVIQIADDISSGERKKIMQSYGISVSIALRTTEKFLGYLLLAEKKSGDIYNTEDIATLKIVANELSVAAQNSLSYKEIQQFSETLAEKVRQRTAQLRRANDQLKELDRAKDEFISMASHQLRTPLTTIKGYVSMLDEGDFGKLTSEQKKYIEQALEGSNRMARLIDDLLNVSRMEAGKFFIDAQKLDLNKVVPQELEQLKNLADSKGVDLRYVKPKKAVPIMNLDENKTRQVIMNLADNAVHYSAPPKGGGKVEVRLEQDGENIVYVVRDNGIGVPREQQGKLFTKMFRAKNAQEVRPDGTGLGLYLVKRVVEDQGGKVVFESEPGKGSVFGFKIPIHNKIVVDEKAQKALMAAQQNN